MFDHMSMRKVKDGYERMTKRISTIKKENEKVIGRGLQVAITGGAAFGWGYANHKWGTVPASDAAALPEVQILGLPADLGAGVLLIGAGFFGAFGKYDDLAFNAGTGSAAAFGYRMGAELGSKSTHEQQHQAPAQVGPRQGARTSGRMHTVEDSREDVYQRRAA